MNDVLIVSPSEKEIDFFTELLRTADIHQITALQSCGEARRLLLERDFDLVLIDAPLRDESGEAFARHLAVKGISQVILVVKAEHYDAVSAVCEDDGVLTLAKPMNQAIFWSALKLCRFAQSRFTRIKADDAELKQKIADIRVVDRAKCLLITHQNMSEKDAHRHIEKQAMNNRVSKRTIAEGILKEYEN